MTNSRTTDFWTADFLIFIFQPSYFPRVLLVMICSIVPWASSWTWPRALSAQFHSVLQEAALHLRQALPEPTLRWRLIHYPLLFGDHLHVVIPRATPFSKRTKLNFKMIMRRKFSKLLKDKEFTSTSLIDADLLRKTGMDSEFELIFGNIGWEEAWHLNENGSRLLTI
jgi:hypothetical protein